MGSAPIPPALARNVIENWAGEGEQWLIALPSLVADVAAGWELAVGPPYELSFHWVAPVTRADGSPAAIDPHGVVGDRGYDCGAMLYNPDMDQREHPLLALVPARIEQLADGFGIPIERVVAWGFVMGVLSEVWTAQGGTPGSRALDVALLLEPWLP
jgi:Aminoglycoside/hydroxyurea antibiotic resistance kinase